MIDGLLNLQMDLLAADRLVDDVARFAPIGVGAAARACLLRIAALVFDEP